MPDLDHLRIDGTTYDLKDSTAREKNAVQDGELNSLKSALDILDEFAKTGQMQISSAFMVSGSWAYSTPVANSKRLRTKELIPVKKGMALTLINPTLQVYVGLLASTSASSYIQTAGWFSAGSHNTVVFSSDGYALMIVQSTNDITVSNYDCTVYLNTVPFQDIQENVRNLVEFNTYDMFHDLLTKTSGSLNGITYAWADDVCTVSGTATKFSANVLLNPSNLPSYIVPGKTYRILYSTTNSDVALRLIFYNGSTELTPYLYAANDRFLTIPSNATRWTISLVVTQGTSFTTPVTVSNIAMLSAATNTYLSDNAIYLRGILPNNADFNYFLGPGVYTMQSNYTYINNPMPEGVGGVLIVAKAFDGLVQQLVTTIEDNSKMYTRTSVLSVFQHPWTEITGDVYNGDIYNNTFNNTYHDNSYEITCQPEITTDTNNYLASTNDNTDRTADIQTMLNTTGVCRLGPGRFVVTGIDIPAYGVLSGCGNATAIVLDTNVAVGYAIKLKTHSAVESLRIIGNVSGITPSSTVGTRHGILFEGTKVPESSDGTTYSRARINDCAIYGFTGGGITCKGTGVEISTHVEAANVEIFNCGAGICIPYYSEFHRFTNCAAQYCYYGCVDNGGNNNFVNCDFSGNTVGLLIDNSTGQSPNNAHGTFSACSFHHSGNNSGTAIRILGASFGEMFVGAQIGFGSIEIDNSKGIRFVGGNILNNAPMTITNCTCVTFSACNFWNAKVNTLTASGNTRLSFNECYLLDGTAFDPTT